MTCSTDLAVWHESTGARQRPLTGTPDLRANGEVGPVPDGLPWTTDLLKSDIFRHPHEAVLHRAPQVASPKSASAASIWRSKTSGPGDAVPRINSWYFARWGYPAGFHRVTGGLEVATGLLLLIPVTSRVGALGSAIILLAAVATLIRFREWGHLPGAAVLTAAAAAIAIHG